MPSKPPIQEEHLADSEARQFYTPGEVAKLFGVTPKTVSNWCDQGHLEYITTPTGHRRIPVSALKGGRAFDQQLDALKTRLNAKNKAAPPPDGDAISAEVQGRRQLSQLVSVIPSSFAQQGLDGW